MASDEAVSRPSGRAVRGYRTSSRRKQRTAKRTRTQVQKKPTPIKSVRAKKVKAFKTKGRRLLALTGAASLHTKKPRLSFTRTMKAGLLRARNVLRGSLMRA